MTDPLTGKELVEKSYEYIDRLTRECTKVLVEEYNRNHNRFSPEKISLDVGADIAQWFEKRDRNIRLSPDAKSITRPQPNQFHESFKGSTKDADFELSSSIVTFQVPGSEYSGNPICFVKSLVINADKAKFTRRKV